MHNAQDYVYDIHHLSLVSLLGPLLSSFPIENEPIMRLTSSWISSSALCTLSLILTGVFACDDQTQSATSPILTVLPQEVMFPDLTEGESSSVVTLEVSNSGTATLIISRLELEEEDTLKEISVLDEADWNEIQQCNL